VSSVAPPHVARTETHQTCRRAGGGLPRMTAACKRLHLTQTLVRRGRRYPPGAHGGAVCAALRLRCGARPGVAPHNSLRSLRSLRSNTCGESVYEARCARRPRACAPRRPTNRACRVPPAAQMTEAVFAPKLNAATAKGCAGRSLRAPQGSRRNAPTASAKRCGLSARPFAARTHERKADVEVRQRAASRHMQDATLHASRDAGSAVELLT